MAYKGAKGVLLVCDLTRKETLENLQNWYNGIKKVTDEIPKIILANKCDLATHEFGENDINAVAQSMDDSPYIITSAKTGDNVNEAFYKLGEFVIKSIDAFD
jgi:GTPase SAR1 family protein